MPITQQGQRSGREPASATSSRPRLGVLATHPIQYQAPLYQELARRGAVDLDVAFLSSAGASPFHDPGFGVTLAWDIDLLGGYRSTVLARRPLAGKAAWLVSASSWLRQQDVVVLHGHSDPEMLLAAAACRLLGVPYLLRGDSQAESSVGRPAPGRSGTWSRGPSSGTRRERCPSGSGTPLSTAATDGHRSTSRRTAWTTSAFVLGPMPPGPSRAERLASLGLDPERPTVIFSGKLIEQKRPLDLARAIERSARSSTCCCSATGRCGRRCTGTSSACRCAASASSTRPSCRPGTPPGTSWPCRAIVNPGDWWSTRAWPAA